MGGTHRTNILNASGANIEFIWNANNRMVGGAEFAKLGDGGYDRGARARQIRDDLRQLPSATQKTCSTSNSTTELSFSNGGIISCFRTLSKPGALSSRERLEFRSRLGDWSGRADVGSIAYRLVREYREEVARRVFEPDLRCGQKNLPRFFLRFSQVRGPTLEHGRVTAGESCSIASTRIGTLCFCLRWIL